MSSKTHPEIPPELVIEILARMPVKPLLRWKCVCKSWLSLISNDVEFAKKHLLYAKNDTIVNRNMLFISTFPLLSVDHDALCYANNNNLVKRELTFPILGVHTCQLSYIGSCNGLIAATWHSKNDVCDVHFIVWNPTSGDFRELPAPDLSVHYDIFWGFGYDSNLDDYKIVIGESFPSRSLIELEVFSFKANEWSWSQDVHSNFSLDNLYSSTNGFVHWLVDLKKDPNQKLGVVSFDLVEEKFLEMVPVPYHITKKLSGLTVQGVGDNDVWVCGNYGCNKEWYEGWMMKRDGSKISWTKLYSFSRDTLPTRREDWIDVQWIAKNGNIVLDVDFNELQLYNPEEQSSLKYGLNSNAFEAPFTYMETLVSPKW